MQQPGLASIMQHSGHHAPQISVALVRGISAVCVVCRATMAASQNVVFSLSIEMPRHASSFANRCIFAVSSMLDLKTSQQARDMYSSTARNLDGSGSTVPDSLEHFILK